MTETVAKRAACAADVLVRRFSPMFGQTNELLDTRMLSVYSSRPQTLQNHILALGARAKPIESHSCEKQGEGSPRANHLTSTCRCQDWE